MAVHLNAHLKTRFIPILFTGMVFFAIANSLTHADEIVAPREELNVLLKADRKPGFSDITYSAENPADAKARIAAQLQRNEQSEPPLRDGSPEKFSDQISTQPLEAEQR